MEIVGLPALMPITNDKSIQIRSFLMGNVDVILESLNAHKEYQKNSSEDIFGVDTLNPAIPWKKEIIPKTKFEILQLEKYSLGVYMSGDPLEEFKPLIDYFRKVTQERHTLFVCILDKFRKIFTKSGGMMLALQVIAEEGKEYEALIFPKNAMTYSPLLEEKELYWILGRIDDKTQKKKDEVTKESSSETTLSESSEPETVEFQTKPKILVSHLVKFETGVLELLKTDAKERKSSLLDTIPDLNWSLLKTQPNQFQNQLNQKLQGSKIIGIDGNNRSSQTLKKIETDKVEINRKMSVQEVRDLKSRLKKAPFEGGKLTEVWIESNDGIMQKVKGQFWI